MNKLFAAVLFLGLALSASAQSVNSCLNLGRGLALGSRGVDVQQLQQFLIQQGDLVLDQSTTYYGPLTRAAITKFQTRNGIEGVGVVGPITRAKIRALSCDQVACTMDAKICPDGSAVGRVPPTCEFAACPGENKCRNVSCPSMPLCPIGATPYPNDVPGSCCREWICVGAESAPNIQSISGPTTLAVGQRGTWTIKTSDPTNRGLTYSVLWGDEVIKGSGAGAIAGDIIPVFNQTTTFQHAYSQAGTYTATFVVRNDRGQLAESTITVEVGSVSSHNIKILSPVSGEKLIFGDTKTIRWSDPLGIFGRRYSITTGRSCQPCPPGYACPAIACAFTFLGQNISGSRYDWEIKTSGNDQEIHVCEESSGRCGTVTDVDIVDDI